MPTDEVADRFDDLVGELVYSMLVVTARHEDTRAGCLVGFTTQVSIDPVRYLVCLSTSNRTYRLAEKSDQLAVHVVPADRLDLAELFGGETGDDIDKFAHVPWEEGPAGLPLLADCPRRFVGRVRERVPFGDHVGYLLDPLFVETATSYAPLTSPRALAVDAGKEA